MSDIALGSGAEEEGKRSRCVEALHQLLTYADELKDRTAARVATGDLTGPQKVTFLASLRARRILQGIRALVPLEIDDVIGNLARSLVEAAVDLEYLHVTSTIVRKKRARILGPETKADLFATQIVIIEKELAEALRPEHEKWHKQAVALRQQCGLSPKSAIWHGRNMTGDGGVFEELLASASGDKSREGRLKSLLWAYRMTSFFEHNSPSMNFYIRANGKGGFALLETCQSADVVGLAVIGGSDVCWTWAGVLGVADEERYARLSPILALTNEGDSSAEG